MTNSFGDIVATGQATSAGAQGMSTAQMQQQVNFTAATGANGNVNPAWDTAGTWVIYDGHTYPLLQSFMTPLTVTATDTLSGALGNYTLIEPTGLDASITPARLIYTAAIVSGFVGQDPKPSGMVVGFVPGDTLADSTAGSLTWTIAGNTTRPGRYAIDGGGLSAGNYTFAQAVSNTTALTLTTAAAPQPVIDATAQLESDVLSAREVITVDATTAFAGSVTLHVLSGGVKLPADALNTD